MRKMMITGNIVADAKKEVSSTGQERISFRIGNNDYCSQKDENGKQITYWFSVVSFNPRAIGLVKYLTKGKPISIIGNYEDNLYQNKKTGNCEIGRNIIADSIDFIVSGNNEGNTTTTSTTATNATSSDFAKATNKGATKKEAPKPTMEILPPDEDDDDDLPF